VGVDAEGEGKAVRGWREGWWNGYVQG
jgi:hypothetical protein